MTQNRPSTGPDPDEPRSGPPDPGSASDQRSWRSLWLLLAAVGAVIIGALILWLTIGNETVT